MFYKTTDYEDKLLQQSIDTSELCILQRKSLTRLQFFLFNKKNYIRSTSDEFKTLRIIILSLLVKIYSQYSDLNQKRLDYLKNIIYSTSLQKITKDKGLLNQQLHKLVAAQLQKLTVGLQAQSYLLNIFNCVAFFDEIVLRSVQQNFQFGSLPAGMQILQKQLKQNFQLQIVWNAQNVQNQGPNQLYIWKSNDGILRESVSNMTFIGQTSSEQSAHSSGRNDSKRRKNSKSRTMMLQTISVNDSKSPYQLQNTRKKQKELRFNNQNISGFQNHHFSKSIRKSKGLFNSQSPQVHTIKNSTSKKKSLWDILCCSSEQK